MNSLKQKSIDSVIWKLVEKIGIQLIKVVLGVVLARLLTPEDYGLIGMITVFFALSMVFIDSGFGLAYIQKQDANETDASTIFYFNLIVSSLFYLILWFAAPIIANFYNEIQLIPLIRVMSLVLIINSFSLIQLSKLNKELDFKKKTILILISAILASSAGIIAALANYGVWSLVIQEIVRAIIKALGLWFFIKWRPLLLFSVKSLKSMLSYSSWVLFMGMLTAFFDNIYIMIIGKYFPADQLGFYTKATQFQKIISQTPSNAVGSVSFPVFSKIQNDGIALKGAMKKFNQHTMFFVAPLCAIFFVIAEPFFLVLLTEKWLPMVPYFKLLLIVGLIHPVQAINIQILSAQGKMKLNFKLSLVKNILRIINISIMYRYGVINIIYGEIIISFISLVINTYYTKIFINYGVLEQLKDISSILVVAISLALIGNYLNSMIINIYFKIFGTVLFISLLFLFGMYLFNRSILMENFRIIREKIHKKK